MHYYASNAMVFLALSHMYYNYFSGRFKIRNEIIWVTGIIFGTITILEAFSGYDIILNTRAVLAVSIGVSLNYATPSFGPQIVHLIFGRGFPDFILRFYALHIFVLPVVMIILMLVHFPKILTFDVPVVSAVTGGILLLGGLYPVSLGAQYTPTANVGYTLPEWYLTSLYAFLRTFMPKFIAGIIIPSLFILMFMLIPFVDKSKKFSWKDRPFFTALGIASIGQILLTTYWGFYINEAALTPTQASFHRSSADFWFHAFGRGIVLRGNVLGPAIHGIKIGRTDCEGQEATSNREFPLYKMDSDYSRCDFRGSGIPQRAWCSRHNAKLPKPHNVRSWRRPGAFRIDGPFIPV